MRGGRHPADQEVSALERIQTQVPYVGSAPHCWGGCLAPLSTRRQTAALPLALTVAPLAPHACRASEAPSVMSPEPDEEDSYHLTFNSRQDVASGAAQSSERVSWKCVPGQPGSCVLWARNCSVSCARRRASRAEGQALWLEYAASSSPLACLSLPGDHFEAKCSHCPVGQVGHPLRLEIWCSVPETLDSWVPLLRES